MNNLEQIYERILEVLGLFSENQLISYQRRTPKMSDLEVISLNITAEYLSIDSELQLFRKLPNSLINKIERSVYNKRKRRLSLQTEQIRQRISMEFNEFEDIFIVDSMPMKVCETLVLLVQKFVKSNPILHQHMVIVLHRNYISMAINYTQYVL